MQFGSSVYILKSMESSLLADEIALKIKAGIQNGVYRQNDRLTVRKLCEEYGVSDTPVKQALNQLVATGVAVAIPRCGIKVKSFSKSDMRNTWMARLMIEREAVHYAIEAARCDERFVRTLRALLEQTDREYSNCISDFTKENFSMLSDHDFALHKAIVGSIGNPIITKMYEDLRAHECMFVGFDVHSPSTLALTIEQHDAIADACISGDEEGMLKAVEDHISTTIRLYRVEEF